MGEKDFQINGSNFKLRKIDAIRQFHIVRRIGPVMNELVPAMKDFVLAQKKLADANESELLEQAAKIFGPIMVGLSKLSDTDADHVLYGLLSSVEIQQKTGNWASVSTNTTLMMQDLEFPVLIQLAGRAFMYNLSGFFNAHQQTS